MKITIDTNILISSTFWSGNSNKILEKVENKEIELILSKEIIEEFSKVLECKEIKDKIKDKNLEMKRTIEKIISLSTFVEPTLKFNEIKDDSTDNKILECAVEFNSEYIISYDKHLLNLKEFRNIKIVSPEEFLELLKKCE